MTFVGWRSNRIQWLGGVVLGLALVWSWAGNTVAAQSVDEISPTSLVLPPDHLVPYQFQTMGTVVDLTLWTDDDKAAAKAGEAVKNEFDRINRLMSSWLEDSDVAKVNQNAGVASVPVDPELMQLVLQAQKASRDSRGAFDISIGAYRGLWKFDQDIDGSIPDARVLGKRRALVGFRKIKLNKKKNSIKLSRRGMRITLGGIAKGYAVDRSVAILHKLGFVDFFIKAGGDLYASGRKGDRSWRVGIKDPRGKHDASFALSDVHNQTFSTSGDYERFVVKDGVRYHHLLDPATGRPANRSRSVTVMAPNALTADIWSTALFIIGHRKGMKLVERNPDLEAVFVDSRNNVHISTGLKKRLIIIQPPTPGI